MTKVTKEIWIEAPTDKVWRVLADIGAIQDYSPNVAKSHATSEATAGEGASRHCDLLPMGTVEERIVEWQEGQQYTIDIYASKNVPFNGVAHFAVKPNGSGTIVTQTMEFTMKGGVVGALAGRPMEKQIGRVIEGNLLGLKHYVETGEVVTRDVYKRLRKKDKTARQRLSIDV